MNKQERAVLSLTTPVTDDEIDAALDACELIGEVISVQEMRRALEGFVAGRAASAADMHHEDLALWKLGFDRYEKARKLNPSQWFELHKRNLAGEFFDDMIDALPPAYSAPNQFPTQIEITKMADKYDQMALEPCDVCGWKAVIPGECCLNCDREQRWETP